MLPRSLSIFVLLEGERRGERGEGRRGRERGRGVGGEGERGRRGEAKREAEVFILDQMQGKYLAVSRMVKPQREDRWGNKDSGRKGEEGRGGKEREEREGYNQRTEFQQ